MAEIESETGERYDSENDVYYFTFKTGEPSYCVEVNDVLLLEVGLFTKLPTGFRILNLAKQNVARQDATTTTTAKQDAKRVSLETVKQQLLDVLQSLTSPPTKKDREAAVERGLEKVLA